MKSVIRILFWVLVLAALGGGAYWYYFLYEPPVEETPDIEAYEAVLAFVREHPEAYEEVHARLEAFVEAFPDSGRAPAARELARQAWATLEAQIEQAWELLRAEAEQVAEQDPEGAVELLRGYSGPYAERLREQRDVLVRTYRRRIREAHREWEEAVKAATARFEELMKEVAGQLYRMRFRQAQQLLDEARADTGYDVIREDLEAFLDIARPAALMPEFIVGGYADYIGRKEPVTVQLRGGTVPVRIREVSGHRVMADRVLYRGDEEIGTTAANFTFADMTPQERARRLDRTPTDNNLTMMSLLLIQARRLDQAAQNLARVQNVLGQTLREHVEQERQSLEAARPTRFEPVFEPDADNQLIVL